MHVDTSSSAATGERSSVALAPIAHATSMSPPPSVSSSALAPTSMSPPPSLSSLTLITDGRRRVLVVDDHAPTCKLLAMAIRKLRPDLQVCCAEDGKVALDFFHKWISARQPNVNTVSDVVVSTSVSSLSSANSQTDALIATAVEQKQPDSPFDLVLMDGVMPVLDGYRATRQLRELGFLTPIVAITGNAFEEDQQRFFDAGVDALLTKPILFSQLKQSLDQYLPI